MIKRIAQGLGLWVLFVAVAAGAVIVANTGRASAVCDLQLSWPSAGCFLREYKELAAGLLGTGGAIFAAWIAWLAIQLQLRHDEELASSSERAALEAARVILREEFLETFNAAWRAMDLALLKDQDQKIRQRRRSVAQAALKLLPDLNALSPVEELLSNVGPMEKRKLALVLASIRWVYQEKGRERQEELGGIQMLFQVTRIMLSHLHRYLLDFDPALASIFKDRTMTNVNHTPVADEINRLIAESEAGKW
jgi:hypothetical protein